MSRVETSKDILGQCNDIIECEQILSAKVKEISLLGDIIHSDSDIDKLASLISQYANVSEKGVEFICQKIPTSISCLLVWIGAIEYEEGKYWPFIYNKIGLSEEDKWREKLGEIFLNYLQKNGLPISQEGHKYLASILLHCGIPEHCLHEYFEKILLPIIKKDKPADDKEIAFLLESQRENYREIQDIEKKKRHLLKQKNEILDNLRQVSSLVNIWDDLEKIEVLEKEAGNIEEIDFLPDDPDEYKNRKKSEIQTFQSELEILDRNKKEYEQKIEGYSEEDRQILACLNNFEILKVLQELKKGRKREAELKEGEKSFKEGFEKEAFFIFSEAWNDQYGKIIQDIPFDNKLLHEIKSITF